jgi:phospholipid-binding lipoprotein MlaA
MTSHGQNNVIKKVLVCFIGLISFHAVFCYAAEEVKTDTTTQVKTDTATTTETTSTETTSAETTSTQLTDEQVNTPAQTADEAQPEVKDPYEHFNRSAFAFNDKLDIYILKPIATFYNAIMPRPLNQGIHNFFLNIGNLPNIANDILQFNFYQMANDMWRFGINSTIGIGGLFDIGSRIGLMPYSNDFGLTLARWGYKNSNYLVLPFFGPYTIRDTIGIPVDYYVFSIYPHIYPRRTRYGIWGLGVVDRRAQLLQFQDVMDEAALDKYVFVRNAYMQRRAYQIEENSRLGYKDRACKIGSQEQQTEEMAQEEIKEQPTQTQ